MPEARPTPFELVFGAGAQTSFPGIRAALAQTGQDPRNRDAFLLVRDVVLLLRDLRPEEGIGEGIDQLAALVHHGYLFWDSGSATVELADARLEELLSGASGDKDDADHPAGYVQVPERRIWAEVVPGAPQEPLDGFFHHTSTEPRVQRVLGVFGMYPDRPGFTVVEVVGPRPTRLARPDGSPLFSSTLPGGARAGLYSLAGEEELLELGWRGREITTPAVSR
jgi:hypothetical protein